jgi:molybdopterin converting factor subunit 1
MGITVKVLLFASAREAAGNLPQIDITLEDQDANTASFRNVMANKYPNLSQLLKDEDSLTLALNEEYVLSGQVLPLKNGDVVALIPPISGG